MQRHFAAISIQAAVRGLLCRQSWQVLRVATARVQAVYRGSLARRRFLQMKTAVTCIQAAFRSHCLRLQFLQMRTSATTIQAAYRGYISRKELLVPKDATTPATAPTNPLALNSPLAHSISKLAQFFDVGSAHWEAVVRSEEVRVLINYTPASDTRLSSIQPIISNTIWHIDTA